MYVCVTKGLAQGLEPVKEIALVVHERSLKQKVPEECVTRMHAHLTNKLTQGSVRSTRMADAIDRL